MTSKNQTEAEVTVLVMSYLRSDNPEYRKKIIKSMGKVSTRHLHFLSQLYALGEPQDRIEFRKVLGDIFPTPKLKTKKKKRGKAK
jgi:hypothetical protein